jgi:hypothetical protein
MKCSENEVDKHKYFEKDYICVNYSLYIITSKILTYEYFSQCLS